MAREIERKFLVAQHRLDPLEDGLEIRQGFIVTTDSTVVGGSIAGELAWLTLKEKEG